MASFLGVIEWLKDINGSKDNNKGTLRTYAQYFDSDNMSLPG